MENQRWHFGRGITVIGDVPCRFEVTAHKNEGPHDPLDRIPLVYKFEDQEPSNDRSFAVEISNLMMHADDQGQPDYGTHNQAIRFGLVSKVLDPSGSMFTLTTSTLEELQNKKSVKGQTLKKCILRFFWAVNSEWPDEGIGLPDLYDNFYAPKERIQGFVDQLCKGGLLERKSGWRRFLENRGGVKMQTLMLTPDPVMLDRVEQEVANIDDKAAGNAHRVFISYSSHDKSLAGKIKVGLERLGLEAFLAHVDIELSQQWRERIKSELKECDSFVPLITKWFPKSEWTDQEAGMALALDKTICSIMCGDKPHGFLEDYQAIKLNEDDIAGMCRTILEAVKRPDKTNEG